MKPRTPICPVEDRATPGFVSFILAATISLLLLWPVQSRGNDGSNSAGVSDGLRQKAVHVLQTELENETGWSKVHAAEALLALDYPDRVKQVFELELAAHGNEPKYRIGIWRVLAEAAPDAAQREQWVGRIRTAFLDPAAPDRVHAAETLAKLGYQVRRDETAAFESVATPDEGALAANARWVLANRGDAASESSLADLLKSSDAVTRADAAYAIRNLPTLPNGVWDKLATATSREPTDSSVRLSLISAALVHAPPGQEEHFKAQLLSCASTTNQDEKVEMCAALAMVARSNDLGLLLRWLDDSDADVRIASAQVVLRLDRRSSHHLAGLDVIVIVAYASMVLGVGVYWSRKTKTQEGYFLGGRNMRPWMVGMSLFASLLSTISYLAVPGEIIQNGPMFLTGAAASPFIFLVVGWLLIPSIMKFRATSAYEILETRLGISIRMLGSIFFLSLRLLWMAVIIYAATTKVIVPMLSLPPASSPYIGAALGVFTVAYTTLGGLPAVVLNDVMQSFILFFGALMTLFVITITMKGVGHWWPTQWAPNWPAPTWGYDPNARISFIGVAISGFTWYLCTSGSDQMAVQRYLSTRDAKAARRALLFALGSDFLINVFLAILGFALLGYFRANPQSLADGQSIAHNADQLFPRFILVGMPHGITGLVFVALLAASMGSLSSGINSSCSVITVDFLERFRKTKSLQTTQVRQARWVSIFVGIVVILLSCLVGAVKGNLLEVTWKVVNLLVAPLFGLFVMAMFIPRATVLGTIIGTLGGLATVISISYWEEMTGHKGISFIWGMPLGLLTQVALGTIASWFIGGKSSGDSLFKRDPGRDATALQDASERVGE